MQIDEANAVGTLALVSFFLRRQARMWSCTKTRRESKSPLQIAGHTRGMRGGCGVRADTLKPNLGYARKNTAMPLEQYRGTVCVSGHWIISTRGSAALIASSFTTISARYITIHISSARLRCCRDWGSDHLDTDEDLQPCVSSTETLHRWKQRRK